MLLLQGFLFVFFLLYLVNFTGFVLDKCLKINNISIRSIIGFSIHVIFINALYFGLNFNLNTILFLSIFIIIVAHVFFLEKSFIFTFLESFKLSFLIIIFYLLLAQIYGEQFYIFRGNHYDAANYTGMSLISSLYSYSEINSLLNLNISPPNFYLMDFANRILSDRPMVSVFIGLFYFPNFIDLYLVNYLLKIFFVSLVPSAVIFFFEKSKFLISKFNAFLISQFFVFSFFIFYITEIDAYSQLSVFAISLIFISLVIFDFNIRKFVIKFSFYIVIISSAFFLLYPEQASIYFIFILIFILFHNIRYLNNINIFYNFCFFAISFLILTSLGGVYIYTFLLNQFNTAVYSNLDWWGYFGAFVLGAKNIVINLDHVIDIKKYLIEHDTLKTFEYIHKLNIKEHGSFYFLNIVPSFFGAYYINGLDFLNIRIIYFINIILTFSIVIFISFNIKKIFLEKKIIYIFYQYLFFFLLFSFVLIFFRESYWVGIKIFFYFSFFVFLLSIVKFEKKIITINYLLVFFIILFPIYKFNSFNFGIGTYDSFPSILKKNYKISYNLVISREMIKKCPKIYIIRKNSILDKLFAIKSMYYKIDFQFIDQHYDKICEI